MKYLIRLVLTMCVFFGVSFSVNASNEPIKSFPVAEPEMVTLTKSDPAAYRAWAKKGHAFKKANPWTQVWKENSERLNIPFTASAWKRVPAGTVFILTISPKSTVVIDNLEQEIKDFQSNLSAKNVEIREIKKTLLHTQEELNDTQKELQVTKKELAGKSVELLTSLVVLTVCGTLFVWLVYKESKRTKKEHANIVTIQERIKNYEARNLAMQQLLKSYDINDDDINELCHASKSKSNERQRETSLTREETTTP